MPKYKTYHEAPYYTAVFLPKEDFDKINPELVIEPFLDNVKFMLGNEEEENFLKELGVEIDEESYVDYWKVYCVDNVQPVLDKLEYYKGCYENTLRILYETRSQHRKALEKCQELRDRLKEIEEGSNV